MGQMQTKVEGKGTDGIGSPHNKNDVKDRTGAKFQNEHGVNPAYGQGGTGSKGNSGKPV